MKAIGDAVGMRCSRKSLLTSVFLDDLNLTVYMYELGLVMREADQQRKGNMSSEGKVEL